jgi:hypothetical protein
MGGADPQDGDLSFARTFNLQDLAVRWARNERDRRQVTNPCENSFRSSQFVRGMPKALILFATPTERHEDSGQAPHQHPCFLPIPRLIVSLASSIWAILMPSPSGVSMITARSATPFSLIGDAA